MSIDNQLETDKESIPAISPRPATSNELDARLTKMLRYLLDKQIHFVIIALAMLYLAYSWFAVQSKYAQLQSADYANSSISLSKAGVTLNFQRDSASQRPLISSNVNDPLLEFNDLDNSLTVNGQIIKLWDTDHSYQTDAANAKFYHAMTQAKWTLFQEISLGPDPNKVLVEYYYRNDTVVSDVSLHLSHNHSFWSAPLLNATGFSSVLSSNQYLTAEQQSQHPRYNLQLKINTAAFGNLNPQIQVTSDNALPNSGQKISTNYSLREIPINKRTLLASEEITWQDAALNQK